MRILETIRGLGLGGAETLLALRLEERERVAPDEVREVLNTAPKADHFAGRIAKAATLSTTSTGSISGGIVATYRHGRRLGLGDVVVTHSPAASIGYKLAAVGRSRRFAIVDVVHNTRYRPIYTVAGRLLNRQADLCIAVSNDVAAADTTVGYKKKSVILGGVDREAMRAWVVENPSAFADMRASLGIGVDDLVVCNVGNLTPRKNQRALPSVMADAALRKVHLVIVGEGPERRTIEHFADTFGMKDRVHLIGSQPDAWRWIAVSDLMIHPSHHEGLPVVLMEASALGVPTVTTNFGGAAEVAAHEPLIRIVEGPANAFTLAGAAIEALAAARPASEAWADRASNPSYFDVGRYAQDFHEQVSGAQQLRWQMNTWD